MQDATRTSEASVALTDSLVHSLEHRDARPRDVQHSIGINLPGKRGKKRVRRIHMELSFFRQQVRDLELKLKRIKLQNASSIGIVKSEFQSPRSVQNLVENGSDQNSVWNDIAERQLKERLRAEQQQQNLKEKQLEMMNMAVELQKLLKKCDETQQEVAGRVTTKQRQRFINFKAYPADEISADQLAIVTRMRLQMQRQSPSRALNFKSSLSMGPEVVKWDPSVKAGFTLEMQCGTTVPFRLEVAADAYWRFFGCGYGLQRVVRNEAELSTGTIARSFKIQTDFEGFTSKVGGKYTARRYVDDDGISIVWAGSGDVQEINGTRFNGTQLHKRGCITLRRVPCQGPGQISTSTVVEASFETIPVFHESVNKAQQTQTLIDVITKAHSKVDKIFCQRMGALLVEEDWKATFGRDCAVNVIDQRNHES